MLDVVSDEGLPVQRRVLVGEELPDRAVHPRRRRVEMRAEEARDGDPRRGVRRQHPMLHACEAVVGDELKEVADVDDECSRRRPDVDPPPALVKDLETADLVLEEYGEEAGVGVPACSDGKLRLGTGRVVVAEHDLPLVALDVRQVARFEPQRFRQKLEQCAPQVLHLLGVLAQSITANKHKQQIVSCR